MKPPKSDADDSCRAGQLGLLDQRQTRPQCPPKLNPTQLLLHQQLPFWAELVAEPEQRVHECQVEAILWPILELRERHFVVRPSSSPGLGTCADVLRDGGEFGDFKIRRRGASEQGLDSVSEVGQGEELAAREGVEEGGLVHPVERARLDLADPA